MSRKKLKNRKRIDRAQRNILIAAVCIAAVIIGGGICGHVIKKNASETMATAGSETGKTTAKKKEAAKKLTINENETDTSNKGNAEKQSQEDQVEDRSEFAVQPGRTVGTTEQSDEKVVYLTLDDGPSKNTQAVLDILDKYNAKATFFVTGAMPEYKDMIKKAYDKGHTIGMHTYSHDYAKVYASVDAYFQDLDQIGQLVKEEIGYVPCFIRFPGGSSNTISASYTSGIMTTLTQEVQARGYQYYDWNGSSGDGAVRTTEQLVAQATSFHDNNIILLSHDSETKDTTVEALPQIIEYYQSQGYTFKALDLNSYVAHHGVNN
ncbi:polysaccharide deacetylase family protein [Dorea sp.]